LATRPKSVYVPDMANAFVCSVELSKTAGITVKVVNATGKITQTITMDGTSITITCKGEQRTSTITQKDESIISQVKGPQETSTITQKDESIAIKVKDFTIDATTVKVTTTGDTTHDSGAKLTVTSTQDMSLTSSAKATFKSTQAMALESTATLTATATQDAKLSGMNTTVDSQVKTVVKGGTSLEASSIQVKVNGTAQAEFAAPMTNLGQSLTTLKGQMVKVEGALVKLG
jgi:hypothetical protein